MSSHQEVPSFILASGSPRRKELLHSAGFSFDVVSVDIDEQIDESLDPLAIVDDLALRKLWSCEKYLQEKLVLTADTLVFIDHEILGKPIDRENAIRMLQRLSGQRHQVTTSVCLGYKDNVHQFNVTTDVYFSALTDSEINFYLDNFKPYDKAGSYGIQEWIGDIGIYRIDGSYSNVVGLPIHETYKAIVARSSEWLTE